jgi:hypothetical protein
MSIVTQVREYQALARLSSLKLFNDILRPNIREQVQIRGFKVQYYQNALAINKP